MDPKDVLEKIVSIRLLTRQTSEKYVAWFDKNFYDMNRFPTGTRTDLIYLRFAREVAGVDKEKFLRLLDASFDLFEPFGWAVIDDEVLVGKKPAFDLGWHLDVADRLSRRLTPGKVRGILNTILSAFEK